MGFYVVPVISGIAQPDLSQGLIQFVELTGATVILAPINAPGPVIWTLILRQDNTGGHLAVYGAGYFGGLQGLPSSDPNTQSMVNWTIDYNGNNTINSIITGTPHP